MIEPANVTPFRLTSDVAEKRIQELAKTTANVALSKHAKDRMAEREITMTDIYRVLRLGSVDETPRQSDGGSWVCKMTMALRGRRTAGVVVAVRMSADRMVVLTVEWEDER